MEFSTDMVPFLDPVEHRAWRRGADAQLRLAARQRGNPVTAPSQTFGLRQIWKSQVNAHTNMMDQDGRTGGPRA